VPDLWYPGATIMPGAAAGYAKGRTSMETVVAHFTVGRDSTQIGVNGYFHWLVRRDGEVVQFAEVDALTWHVGNWNGYGPGIEVEYLPGVDDEVFTDAARVACGSLVRWLCSEWGFLLDYYDGDRIPPVWRGFIAHRSVQGGDHTDFWPRQDWDLMVAAPAAVKEHDMVIAVGKTVYGVAIAFLLSGGRVLRTFNGPEGAYGIPTDALDWKAQSGRDAVPYVYVDTETVNVLLAPWPAISGGGSIDGGLTVEQTAAVNAGVLSGQLLGEAFPR
jgi:hypothetical protein